MVTEQIANLSTRKCRPGSNPGLSASAPIVPIAIGRGFGGHVRHSLTYFSRFSTNINIHFTVLEQMPSGS